MRKLSLLIVVCVGLATACNPTVAPTNTPAITATPTINPNSTPTPLPTRAPLPTPFPTADTQPSLSEVALSERAKIRTIHTAPNLPRVDVYLGNQVAGFSLDYGEATGQAEVVTGDYRFRLVEAGGRTEDNAIFESFVSLQNGDEIMVVVTPDEDILIFDEEISPLTGQQSQIRVINLIQGSPETTIPAEDGEIEAFTSIGYGEASEPVIFSSGETVLDFTDILEDYTVTLDPRRSYTFVLYGELDSPDVLVFDENAPAQAELSFINLSEEIGIIDVYLNGDVFAEMIDFKVADAFARLATGSYELTFFESGADPQTVTPLLTGNVVLSPDDEVFAMLMGTAADLRLVTYQDSDTPTGVDEARITFINSVSTVPALTDLYNEDDPLILGYAQPVSIIVPAEPLNFEFVTDLTEEDYTTVEYIDYRDYQEGTSYIYLITGSTDFETDESLVFERVVGTDGIEPPETINAEATQEDIPQEPQAYIINAIDRPVDIILNGGQLEGALFPDEATNLLDIRAGQHTFTFTDAETREELYTATRTLQADTRYSLILFGDVEQQNYSLGDFPMNLSDPDVNSARGTTIRLINLTLQTSQRLTLGFETAVQPDQRLSNRIATREALGFVDEPFPLPLGVTGFSNLGVSSGAATELVTLAGANLDLYAYNTNSLHTSSVLHDVQIEPDRHYDYIVTSQDGTPIYKSLLTVYPLP